MNNSTRDIFICHASEDKNLVVRPLVEACNQAGISCWYDEAEILWGDSITQKVNEGLAISRYVVVVFSISFAKKNWPKRELYSVLNQEASAGKVKVLPLLVGSEQDKQKILEQFPLLSDKRYLPWDGDLDPIIEILLNRLGRKRNEDSAQFLETSADENSEDVRRSPDKQLAQQMYDRMFRFENESDADLSHINVLVVDDEPPMHEYFKHFLNKTRMTLAFAEDGMEALERIKVHEPHLVISDLRMQKMSGEELAEIMSKRYPHIPLIIMTAYPQSLKGRRIRCVVFVAKPFTGKEMRELILEIASNIGLYQIFILTFSNSPITYQNLMECRLIIHRFINRYQSNNLFEVAVRHKIKDSVSDFCMKIVQKKSESDELTFQLLKKLERLQSLMEQIKHGSEIGLIEFLGGIKEDIEAEHPKVEVNLTAISDIPPSIVNSDIETLLTFCAIEFTDNALDAIVGEGNIRILLRRMMTKHILSLSVWNDGPNIRPDVSKKIFEEGVTTKGLGRGMGLYIIKSLCDRFDSVVKVTQDDGVQFSVYVPLAAGD